METIELAVLIMVGIALIPAVVGVLALVTFGISVIAIGGIEILRSFFRRKK